MPLTSLLTANFHIQYDPVEFSGPGEFAAVRARAEAFVTGCEPGYAMLCERFGVAAGAGFGPANRVIVTLTKTVRHASSTGYHASHPAIWINPELSSPDDTVLGLFAAEMTKILLGAPRLAGCEAD